ncbi:MATE family efflux transporter [Chitinophaga pinensis]|uniref:Multidrug-efflux transporter n=1 Tax=Chitinophaga pinensis (strain ATCC 43595 / DSM 2588 / LMG 13176 / NBRC 15968 / NCIMB 11800 / UQM 2034) TaxID=485918 RepID=A0A979GW56_CHIPD|nr:MATE family efflux transporter [Chitinophaga pinensis]ACU60320.1 MATE efflux family protein [Chitinophaga pinensis DSM 2588]
MNAVLLRARSILNLFRSAIAGTEKDFTSGSVNRATFLLSVPSMLELAMESLFVMVDLLFVSSLGERAITIVGIVNSVVIIFHSVAMGLSIAATAVISRRVGEKKPRTAGLAAMQAIYLGITISVIFSALSISFNRSILHLAGASAELVHEGDLFSRIMFGCILLVVMRVLMNGIFRGAGNAAMAMRTLLLSNAVNAVLCAVLIFGVGPIPSFGLLGAAMATGIANLVGVSYQCWYFAKAEKVIKIGRQQLMLVPAIIKRICKLAVSGTLQYIIPSSSRFLMIIIVAKLGESVLAGYIVANRIIMFTVLPAWGIANAAGVLTGQNLGAGQPERAEQSVWKTGAFNMCFLGSIALFLLASGESIVHIFTREQTVAQHAALYLRYMSIAYFFFGYTMVISRSLNAAGSVNVVTLLYVLMFYITQLPLAWFLGIHSNWGPQGIFIAILASEIVLAAACLIVFRSGKWKKVKI